MQDEIREEVTVLQKRGKLFADLISRVVPPGIGMLVAGPAGAVACGALGALFLLKILVEIFIEYAKAEEG